MAENSEKSFPFDSDEVNGEEDRVYFAKDWCRYFEAFISSGTFLAEPTNLQIISNGDMSVTLKPGSMMIDGARYDNIDDIIIQLSPADGVLSRIDRISITWSAADRDIHYTLREGEMSYSPAAPECRRTEEYKDYVVADVLVAPGVINISQTNITDQRLNSEVCGLAIPFATINTEKIFLQLQAFYEETVKESEDWMESEKTAILTWFDSIKEQLSENAEFNLQNQINELKEQVGGLRSFTAEEVDTMFAEVWT